MEAIPWRDRFLVLASNGNPLTHPGNRSDEFTAALAEPITNPGGGPIFLVLCEIFVPARLAEGSELPGGLLKVHVQELTEQALDRSFGHTAAIFRHNEPRRGAGEYFVHHAFRHAVHLPLKFSQLRRVTVKLTDLFDRPVSFAGDVPTVLSGKMSAHPEEEQFTMTCTSYHPTLFPGNTLSDFLSPLPKAISLAGYEVALRQLIFPASMRNKNVMVTLEINGRNFGVKVGSWRDSRVLVGKVQEMIARAGLSTDLTFSTVQTREDPRFGNAYFRRAPAPPDAVQPPGPCVLDVSENFAKFCGVTSGRMPGTIRLDPGESYYFPSPPNLFNVSAAPFGILGCDIVGDGLVGASKGRVIQTVPLFMDKRRKNQVGMYEPDQLVYHEVSPHPFNSIRFSLHEPDMTVKELESDEQQDMMMVTLIFRRIPQ